MNLSAHAQPADLAARQRALDPEQSFIVSAPAGSGKTGLLTQRVLKLLARCEQPEDILAITFTRKAAQEMRQRIVSALHRAQDEARPAAAHDQLTFDLAQAVLQRNRAQGWNLLLVPQRLRIQTIDSFSQSVVNQLPFTSDLCCFQQATENAEHLYRQAIHDFLELLKEDSPLRGHLDRLLLHLDNNLATVENLLASMLKQRNQWLGTLLATKHQIVERHHLETSVEILIEETLARFKQALAPCWGELTELCHFAGQNLINGDADNPLTRLCDLVDNADTTAANLPLWQALVQLLLTDSGEWRKSINKKQGFPPDDKKDPLPKLKKQQMLALLEEWRENPALLELANDVKALPPAEFDSQQWELLDSLAQLLPHLVAQFTLTCQAAGECDFNAIAYGALSALGETDNPSELALKLDYRIQHILVDEFQDTSLPQLQLLERLTAGWQPGDGRTLFVVGDAMQSCYGFRDANVSIFLGVQAKGIGEIPLEPVELSVNFRAHETLVDWVNETFVHVFPADNDIGRGAIRYQTAASFFKPPTDTGVHIEALIDQDLPAEAGRVATIVQHHLQREDDESVAILVRNRNHLHDILTVLRQSNVTWQAKDVDRLANRMAVMDLLSLTRALLDYSDRIAWLAILRAPWCGLDMNDLQVVANHTPGALTTPVKGSRFPLLWNQICQHRQLPLSEAGAAAVARLHHAFAPALHRRARKSLRHWVEGTWLALGGPAAVSNPIERQAAEDFFKLLERHDTGGHVVDWSAFEDDLNRLYDSSTTPSRLHVMTLHKAKGLEFDTVIIPGLNRPPRADDNELLLWQDYFDRDGEAHLLLSPVSESGVVDPLYAYLKREKTIRQRLESARLLYIGCTRAIRHLYLLMSVQRDQRNGALKAPGKNSLASHVWDAVQDQIQWREDEGETLAATADDNPTLAHLLRLPPTLTIPPPPRDDTLQAYRPAASFADNTVPPPELLVNRHARHMGTVLHQALCDMTLGGREHWTAARLQQQQPIWRARLQQLGLSGPLAQTALEKIVHGVRQTLDDPRGRWLVDPKHAYSQCELRLLADDAREYVVDRTFVDADTLWVVDYKSSEPAPGQAQDDFLAAEVEHYRGQLQTYVGLVQRWLAGFTKTGELTPRAALYFPLLQIFREVDL